VVRSVTCTEWLTDADDKSGAAGEQPAYPWAPRYHAGVGRTLFAASVPMAVKKGARVRVQRVDERRGKLSAALVVPVIEKGPHHTDDEYLITGGRPRAEAEGGNSAGIDVTPPVMAALLGVTTEEAWSKELSCKVDAQLIDAEEEWSSATPNARAKRMVDAVRGLPKPFPYAPETQKGELGCAQVISTALLRAGELGSVRLAVRDLRADLEGKGWRPVDRQAPVKPADVVVWGPAPGGTHDHVGMITEGTPGALVIQNSSAERRVVERPLDSIDRPIKVILRHP
jgi:hypothetical protein